MTREDTPIITASVTGFWSLLASHLGEVTPEPGPESSRIIIGPAVGVDEETKDTGERGLERAIVG